MRRVGRVAAAFVVAAIVACDTYGEDDPSPAPIDGADGGVEGSTDPCTEHVLYVSGPAGNDANDGCSRERPIKTIGAALALAASKKLDGYDVRVCGGVYAEPGVKLTTPVALHGQYNCATWTRGGENVTRLENTGYPAVRATLAIEGASIGRDVVVDGFVVAAPANGTTPASAVWIADGARPLLSNVELIAGATGAGPDDAFASAGLDVRTNASPEIASAAIRGGSGNASVSAGSIGVIVRTGASVDIHDSIIESGSGTGIVGATGIYLLNAGPSRISRTRVTFGNGTAKDTSDLGSQGIIVSGGQADISEVTLRGGRSSCADAAPICSSTAIGALSGAKVTVHRSSIYAGDVENAAAGQKVQSLGIVVGKDAEGTITSNVVHAGANVSHPETFAIAIGASASKSMRVTGNTLLATGAKAKTRVGMRLDAPNGPGSGTSTNEVVGNIFVGHGGSSDIALVGASCGGGRFATLTKNVFVSLPIIVLDLVSGDCGTGSAVVAKTTAVDAESYLASLGGSASGSAMLRASCGADCIAGVSCTDAKDCATKVFGAWDDLSGGSVTMDSDLGLRLSPTGPCAINKGDPAFASVLTQDFFGAARVAPFSIGHHEQESCQ